MNLIDEGGIRLATWNVLTLNFPGAKSMLAYELKRFNIAVAGLTETRLVGRESEDIGEGYHLIWSGDPKSKTNGVGLALNARAKRCLLSYKQISDRILMAQLQHKHGKWTIIVCYAPTNPSPAEVKDQFYAELSATLSRVPPHDIVTLLGDLNATVNDREGVWRSVLGPVTPDSLNDNGQRLLQLCNMHNLVISNTLFQRRDIHKYTWYSNDGQTKKMIDYVMISGRWRSSITNCRTYRSAELGNTDHRMVVATLRLRLRAQGQERRPPKLDLSSLATSQMQQKYALDISNRFSCLQVLDDPEVAWKSFKDNILDSAGSTIGRSRHKNKPWISQETLSVIELRRKARLAKNMPEYRRLNGLRNSLLHSDRKTFVDKKASDLEDASRKGDTCSLYKHLRELTEGKTSTVSRVFSADGSMPDDDAGQLSAWSSHFSTLLNAEAVAHPDPDLIQAAMTTPEATSYLVSQPFTTFEIQNAVKRLNNNRAPGVCGISAELLKYGGAAMILWLQIIFSAVWTTESIPNDWRAGIILPLWKRKGSRQICSNYRGITLLSVPGKLFAMSLLDRCSTFLRRKRRVQQAGFMPGRSTTEQMFTMRQLIEKTREFHQKAYIAFVDFKAAFDSVDRRSLWLILRTTGLPKKYCSLFEKLYEDTESCVQVNGRRSPTFPVKTGVRQGCAAAPELFNCVIDHVMTSTTNRLQFGLQFGDRVLSDADFADDIALVASTVDKMTKALQVLSEEASKVGLKINWQKTKVMLLEPPTSRSTVKEVNIGSNRVDVVEDFTYLGSILSNDGLITKELTSRIAKASALVGRLSSIWRKPNISRFTKMRIYNASVSTVLLYGAETWPAAKSILSAVDVAQTKHLRRIERLHWTDFVSNQTLLSRTAQTPFSTQLAQRTVRWYGHLLRMPRDAPARVAFDFDPTLHGWKRPRGRPPTRWKDKADEFLTQAHIPVEEAASLASDRSTWRRLVSSFSTPNPRQEP